MNTAKHPTSEKKNDTVSVTLDGSVQHDGERMPGHQTETVVLNEYLLDMDEKVTEKLTQKPADKYKFRRSIGQGGMKTVLQVRDKDTARDVAMAVLPDSENRPKSDIYRFVQEARITALLEHPNIVPVHDIGVDSTGSPYFTMKLLKGENLASILKKLDAGEPEYVRVYDLYRLLRIFLKICNGIAFAHSKGVIHLDIKPENVQIGDFGEVLILDWGLAKIIGTPDTHSGPRTTTQMNDIPSGELNNTPMTMDGVTKGTPGYMAPEQAQGRNKDKDFRTDIYALGAILYAILTRKDPVEGSNVKQMIRDTVSGNIVPPRERAPHLPISSAIEAVCMKAMALEPENRYQTAKELRDEIYSFLGGFATIAEKATPVKKTVLLFKRHKLVFVSLACTLILLIMFGSYAAFEMARQMGGWIKIYDADFSKSGVNMSSFTFMDSNLTDNVKPWSMDTEGIKMERGEWLWLKDLKVPEDTRLVIRFECTGNPDALEVCLNSKIEKLKDWWHVPTGYSFQIGGFGGTKDLIFKNEDAFAPNTIAESKSRVELNKIHTVTLQRHGNALSITMDGNRLLEATDILPVIGPELENIGMRTFSTSMKIISISAYRLAMPLKASPLIAGVALVETGHFDEAVAKYIKIAENYGNSIISQEALTRAYGLTASSRFSDDRKKLMTLTEIKKKISLYPQFVYWDQILEVDAVLFWRDRRYTDAFALLPEIFRINPKTSVVTKLLQIQHQPLSAEVLEKLFDWIRKSHSLTRLNISNFGVTSLRQLQGLPLVLLDCSENELTSLEGIDGMRLEVLSCNKNNIRDIEALRGMTSLRDFNCYRNQIGDLEPLKGSQIKFLNVSYNNIVTLESLRGLPLEKLYMTGNKAVDLDPLRGMPLKLLDCSQNQITNLEPLKTASALNLLSVSENPLSDISPIAGLKLNVFEALDCPNLTDISPLAGMDSLERLAIPAQARNIEFLKTLPSLKYLSNRNSALSSAKQETVEEFWRDYANPKVQNQQ